jgi:hypothetical protein
MAVPANRGRALPDDRPPMEQDHARAVRRRRGHRYHLVLRAWAAVAGVDAGFRERVRPRLHARGLLVLPRGHLHGHLRLRLGPAQATDSLDLRVPDRVRWRRRFVLRHQRQRVDEPPVRFHAAGRPRRRRASVESAVRQPDVLLRVHPHVLRGLHRLRILHGGGVRLVPAPRPVRPLRKDSAVHLGDRRRGGLAAAGHHR